VIATVSFLVILTLAFALFCDDRCHGRSRLCSCHRARCHSSSNSSSHGPNCLSGRKHETQRASKCGSGRSTTTTIPTPQFGLCRKRSDLVAWTHDDEAMSPLPSRVSYQSDHGTGLANMGSFSKTHVVILFGSFLGVVVPPSITDQFINSSLP
jgi:hypothetical protein